MLSKQAGDVCATAGSEIDMKNLRLFFRTADLFRVRVFLFPVHEHAHKNTYRSILLFALRRFNRREGYLLCVRFTVDGLCRGKPQCFL